MGMKELSNFREFLSEEEEETKGGIDMVLPRGKEIVLKAEDKDYERGLLVTLLEDGGYEVKYPPS